MIPEHIPMIVFPLIPVAIVVIANIRYRKDWYHE
jgi:hypothetical protein